MKYLAKELKFTPLEFETAFFIRSLYADYVKIYSVGVWNDFRADRGSADQI